ncbi:MAG: hypothetical protein PHQ52_02875 [Candidatus Omnitrophica bacterium]|nr:hypothetical protein [Candidatus Omnitrophota bacterium]
MKEYDFAISWSGNQEEKIITFLKANCKEKGLSFFWVDENNVKDTIKKLESHLIKIKVLLDTEATYNKPNDIYSRLCYAVKDSGGSVINDPDRAKASIDKSAMHFELLHSGITVPYTVIVRNWEPTTFKLTFEEKNKLGKPFVIKPAQGYGQLGVIKEAQGTISEIAKARHYDTGDNFLIQEKINPITICNKRSWFRVLNVFDTLIPCWWDDKENHYEHVSFNELYSENLFPLVKITAKIASISRMSWFSTEIAIDVKQGKRRFVAIDYVNDQCDMTTKSEARNGLPDKIVEFAAKKMIEWSYDLIFQKVRKKKYTIFLENSVLELKGLGVCQDLLMQK